MSRMGDGAGWHDRYAEMCALATSGTLSLAERQELEAHLAACRDCHEAYRQYFSVTSKVIPVLAQDYEVAEDQVVLDAWDSKRAATRLFASIRRTRVGATPVPIWLRPAALAAIAACLLAAVGLVAHRAGKQAQPAFVPSSNAAATGRLQAPDREKLSLQQQLATTAAALEKLQMASAAKEGEINKLETALHAVESRLEEMGASDSSKTAQLQALANERDSLAQQLRSAQQSYKTVEEELDNRREERDRAVLRAASLDSEVQRLSARVHEQDRSLEQREQYLASDRDIRELMGARQLYIADVFDVDKNGNKRKPFGRVFYTKEKSLIFYAFDLDQQPGVKNASTFQAWGQRDSKEAKPLSLGILYMDNEAQRRWVLHFDDPNRLAEIDAVFVTVEPNGGSVKPSGKPLLYASLRKLPNHP